MAEQLYTIQVSDYSNSIWPHYFVHIELVKAKHYHREDDEPKWARLEAMSVSFTNGFVTNILGVLKFFEDYIPCFRNYAHDCLIEKGTFEFTVPLSDIYYEE